MHVVSSSRAPFARRTVVLAAAALAASAGVASAAPKGIFSNIPAAGNNAVPGTSLVFTPGTGSASAFDRPFFSPDGSKWFIAGIGDDPTDDKEVLIVGGGTTGTGASTVAIEDQPTAFDSTITWGFFRTRMGINNAGQYVFSADTTADTTKDDMIVRFDGVSQFPVVRESEPSPIAGQNFGTPNDSAHILADGTARFRSGLSPTTTKQIIGGPGVIGETDVTIPGGQLVAPAQSVDNFTSERFTSSSDGTKYIYRGDLNGPTTTDDIIVVNGNVVIQEGAPLPGGVSGATNVGIISGDAGSQQMSPNGNNWMARTALADGTGATATDVVLFNGALRARTGDPISPGSLELWDDAVFTTTFFINATNDLGDVVVGGLTNSGDVNKDAVLMYYGSNGSVFELLREGDPVDLNGNGLLDDNAFIDIFGNDDLVLTNDGLAYFVASIQDANNLSIGNAYLVVAVPEPSTLALGGLAMAGLLARSRRRA